VCKIRWKNSNYFINVLVFKVDKQTFNPKQLCSSTRLPYILRCLTVYLDEGYNCTAMSFMFFSYPICLGIRM